MDKIRNLSLRKTILLYLTVSLVCTFFLSAVIAKTASEVQEKIWWKYMDEEQYWEAVEAEQELYPYYWDGIPRPDAGEMSAWDYRISELCDFLQTYGVLVLAIAGSGISVLLFYRNKLKKPLAELEQASAKIAGNDLDFQITYENQDEMGHLCLEFERMRAELAQNEQAMWRMVEEERALRAAVSHDIRSPLAILKGYQEMLLEFLPDGTIGTEQAVEMLEESRKQIERMDTFVETMQKMSSLEQRKLEPEQITAEALEKELQAELAVLAGNGKQISLEVLGTSGFFCGDKEVILEVTENLLSNALRYAKERVEVRGTLTAFELRICVQDDGEGFGEEVEKVTKAFYQQNVKDSLKHAGLGMYLSRLYCEKHGGKLLAENSETGGAAVTAVFRRLG
ncbi:MAG: HAMP domain-containing sensor histidine kinase [Eubacteriales bacterium]|nr:HAMP domain-containing sensor histidine kinase [Eubacteriales bacterium]